MTASINFDVFARDRASATLGHIGDTAETTGGRFDKMKGFAVAGAAVAGAALVTFGKDAVGAASDMNETISRSNIIFGENGAEIEKWAAGGARTMGLSKSAALDAAAGFGDMFSQIGFTGDAAADMSKKTVQMSADLGSFNNMPTADVAEKISGAFRGEYDSLQALIPNINAARVEQEALAISHKSTAKELTAADKATAVLAIVQKDGARAAGDYARTASGVANSQKTMAAEADNAKAAFGARLIPIMQTALATGLTLMKWGQEHTDVLKVLGVGIGVVAAAWGVASAATAAAGVVTGLTTAATTAMTIAHRAAAAGAAVVTAAQWAWNAALTANPLGIVIVAIAALVAGLVIAYRTSDTFRGIVDGAFRAVGAGATWLWSSAVQPAFAAIGTAIGAVGTAGRWLWDNALSPAFSAIGSGGAALRGDVARVSAGIQAAFESVGTAGRWLWENALQPPIAAIGNALRALGGAAGAMWSDAFAPALRSIAGAFLDVVGTIIRGAADAFGWVPGVGPKLRSAAAKFDTFRAEVNAALARTDSSHTISIHTPGIDAAIQKLAAVRYAANNIPPEVTVRVISKVNRMPGTPGGLATGTSSWRGGLTWVGEEGPELMDLPRGTAIYPHQESMAMARGGGSTAPVMAATGGDAGTTISATFHLTAGLGGDMQAAAQAIRVELERMASSGTRLKFGVPA